MTRGGTQNGQMAIDHRARRHVLDVCSSDRQRGASSKTEINRVVRRMPCW